ncbi:MAG: deoxyguanosinetriphosphate triphosphohydrolase [bacterium]|nr:deoxyguanosinetriphosphate triphosphohydrolase [bacterium]
MTIREILEEREYQILHPKAKKSKESTRAYKEAPCPIRTEFQRDRDRIIHSKAFRRLKHKTQVFIQPEGDHFRTRLTHTLEVSQIARTIARALFLNEDLTEAISLGHDLGHTPFGHQGEHALNELMKDFGGFKHPEQGVRVVEILEKEGRGLNLTEEVKEGIAKHSKGFGKIISIKSLASTLEGQIVRVSDIISYVNHDLDDAIRAKILRTDEIPEEFIKYFGETSSKRISFMVSDVINTTIENDYKFISMSQETENMLERLRDFLRSRVYFSPLVVSESEKAKHIIEFLFNYYVKNYKEIPFYESVKSKVKDYPPQKAACDYISGMTDRFALLVFEEKFIPKAWSMF